MYYIIEIPWSNTSMIWFGFTETSTVDYVIFETAGTLKDAIVREWNMLQDEDIMSLRQYLLQYIMGKPALPVFVRERILQVSIKLPGIFEK